MKRFNGKDDLGYVDANFQLFEVITLVKVREHLPTVNIVWNLRGSSERLQFLTDYMKELT